MAASRSRARVALHAILPAIVAAVVVLAPPVARAEAEPASPPATLRNYPVCVSEPTADDIAVAKKTFELGVRYFNEADYERAIRYFKDAYQGDCNAHKLLTNIARAYELVGDRVEAIRALEEYLDRSREADDGDTVRRRIAKLKAQMAVQPKEPPSPATKPATGSAASRAASAAAEPKKQSLVPWVMMSLGGAVAVTGGAMIGAGVAKINEAEASCPARRDCPPQTATDGNTGRAIVTGGVVMAGVGVAALGTGLVWHFVTKPSARPSPLGLVPVVGAGFVGASYEARF